MRKDFLVNFWSKYWNFIIAVFIFGLTLVFLWFRNDEMTAQSVRDALMGFLITLLVTFTFRLNAFQLYLEVNQDILSKFLQLLASNPKIKNIIEHSHNAQKIDNQFYKFFLNQTYEEFDSHLHSLAHGKYICNAQVELSITKSILQCCNKCLKAISYQDEAWWESNNGALYLDFHSRHIDRKKEKATRIFIIESSSKERLKAVFKKHIDLRIETFILYSDIDMIDNKYKVDFVIYDDYMLRRASEVRNYEGGKDAIFTSEEIEVNKYLRLFDELLVIAKNRNNTLPI